MGACRRACTCGAVIAVVLGVAIAVGTRVYGGNGWSEAKLPDLSGKTAIITGANTGLGFATAEIMSAAGCNVVLGCRSEAKCRDAVDRLKASPATRGSVTFEIIDLAEPASVTRFARSVMGSVLRIDYLINNAAVMAIEQGTNSVGWELQMAINHMGHFLLVQRLLPLLKASKTRIVNHSSAGAHLIYPTLDPKDIFSTKRPYRPMVNYGYTKRANLWFTHELNQRLGASGITATACHPGYTSTELQRKASGIPWMAYMMEEFSNKFMGMEPLQGALPQVYAAVVAEPGQYIIPAFFGWGPPVVWGTPMRHWPYPEDSRELSKELWDSSVAALRQAGVSNIRAY